MADALTPSEIAQLCWDNYYAEELTGADKISAYLLNGDEEHDNTFDNLSELLHDDIRDLLHNGNQEDLFGSDYDPDKAEQLAHELHDGWNHDPDPLGLVCDEIARLALNTITNGA